MLPGAEKLPTTGSIKMVNATRLIFQASVDGSHRRVPLDSERKLAHMARAGEAALYENS